MAFAKPEAFLLHDYFFDICCPWWFQAVLMGCGAVQPHSGVALSQSDLEGTLSVFFHAQTGSEAPRLNE